MGFKGFLTDHQQFVLMNDTSSSLLHILLGVPQGLIVGRLL
jgi:hypothetical protein